MIPCHYRSQDLFPCLAGGCKLLSGTLQFLTSFTVLQSVWKSLTPIRIWFLFYKLSSDHKLCFPRIFFLLINSESRAWELNYMIKISPHFFNDLNLINIEKSYWKQKSCQYQRGKKHMACTPDRRKKISKAFIFFIFNFSIPQQSDNTYFK